MHVCVSCIDECFPCVSEKILSVAAVHPFTGEQIPIVVSKSTQFDYHNNVMLGEKEFDFCKNASDERYFDCSN